MFVGCQWVFTTFVCFWKVLWVWSGFLGKVLGGMLVRVWEETIADIIVGKCSWVCSGSRFNLCSVVWEAHQGVWSGFLGRFMGDMIRRTWEETIADHPLQGIAVRIGFWNLELEFWISEFWVLILGVWILEFFDCWFPSFVFGRFDGSEVVSLGRFWGRCLWESEGKPLQTLQSRKWSCFCPVFFWKVLWVWSGFLGKVLDGMLVRVWEETIADTIVGKCSWVCSGSRFNLCSVVWEAHQGVWSGFLGRFVGDMIRRTWEETIADHPLQGIAVRIGFWNLELEFWISGFWFWILDIFVFSGWNLDLVIFSMLYFYLDIGTWILDCGFGILVCVCVCFFKVGYWILVCVFFWGAWISEFKSWSLDFGAWILDLGIWSFDLGCFGFWILECWFWNLDFGFWILAILDLGFWNSNFGVWILNLEFWILDDFGGFLLNMLWWISWGKGEGSGMVFFIWGKWCSDLRVPWGQGSRVVSGKARSWHQWNHSRSHFWGLYLKSCGVPPSSWGDLLSSTPPSCACLPPIFQVGNIDLRQGLPVPMDAVAMLEVPENGLRVNLGNTLVET